ncbi:MAG: hypothetical protein ABIQ86_10250 [Steroidobacteraceae bacterium]
MEADISQPDRMQGPARAVAVGEPVPLLGLMFAVCACGASSVAWLWFTSPKPNYFWNLAVPMLVFFLGGVVVPILVLFVGGVFGLFQLDLFRLTAAARTRRRYAGSRRRKYYAFALLFTGAAMISIMFHVPLYARFALSRPAMDAFIADVQENPDAVRAATMRVGWFVLESAPRLRRDGALMFHLPGDNETGFTYSTTPIGYPGGNEGDGGSLGGGWYWFSDD